MVRGDRMRAHEVGDERQVVRPGVDRHQVGLAVEVADEQRSRLAAHGKDRGVLVVEEPAADARDQPTWFEPLTLTARLGGPPVDDGTIAVATGPIPCWVAVFRLSRGPGTNVKPSAVA